MERRARRRLAATVGCVVALSLLASASSASASVTIGQVAPASQGTCNTPADRVQPTVISGTPYVVPGTGGISSWILTSWSHNTDSDTDQVLTMKVFRQVAGLDYSVVGHDGPRALAPSTVNTFPTSIPVRPGDVLGLYTGDTGTGCIYSSAGDTYLAREGDLADGSSGTFTSGLPATPNQRLNISAVVNPTNTFSIGQVARNKKKGTATLTVTVPNPGELTASGKGVKAAGAATISKAVTAGAAKLVIRAKGKKKRKLNTTGKVKLNTTITFTPTGGDAFSQPAKVKLKKL